MESTKVSLPKKIIVWLYKKIMGWLRDNAVVVSAVAVLITALATGWIAWAYWSQLNVMERTTTIMEENQRLAVKPMLKPVFF